MSQEITGRATWHNRTAFVMAAVGSAVGLGNVWRFPYVAYSNGGGAFIVPYFIALVTVGIPLMILEYALGQRFQCGAPMAMEKIGKRFKWVGWFALFVGLTISFYYVVVMGYAWFYMLSSPTLAWTKPISEQYVVVHSESEKQAASEQQLAKPEAERRAVVTEDENAGVFFADRALGGFKVGDWIAAKKAGKPYVGEMFRLVPHLVVLSLLTWVLIFFIVYKGVETVGKVVMLTVPLPVILLGILIIQGLSLEGAGQGILYLLKPNWAFLGDPSVWLAAYGQIFFSLSLGFGILIAYASYKPKDAEISNDARITSFCDAATSFYASFAVFSVVGYLAVQTNQGVADVVRAGPGLVFVTYPIALAKMGATGRIVGTLFFLSLLTLGIDSAFSIVEAVITGLHDAFRKAHRGLICGIICGGGFLFGLIFCTRSGLMWLDIVDHWMTHYGLVLVGLLECIAVGYFWNIGELRTFVNERSEIKLDVWWDTFIKFLIPLVLIYLISAKFVKDSAHVYEGYDAVLRHSVTVAGWVYFGVLIVLAFAVARNWGALGWVIGFLVVSGILRMFIPDTLAAAMGGLGFSLLFGGFGTGLWTARRGKDSPSISP